MPDQIYIGNFAKGLQRNREPFNIDNDAFPTLFNAYAWRGNIKRKRGTSYLARLQRQIQSVAAPVNPWEFGPLALVADAANLITGFGLEPNGSITPGTIIVTVGANTYTEPAVRDGTLVGAPGGGGFINYATGAITITGGGAGPLTGTFSYFPNLPVLGLEDYVSNFTNSNFPFLVAFDPQKAYQINEVGTPFFYDVTYYKGTNIPFEWTADDSNQFWSTNYQSAFWVTNNKPGLHLVYGTYIAGSATNDITFSFVYPNYSLTPAAPYLNLIVGDKLFFNEWPVPVSPLININGLTGTVLTVVGAGTYIVHFTTTPTLPPIATGIAQLFTNSVEGQDGIRWYDGDPTGGTGIPTITELGWVNFSPPLTALTVSINDQVSAKYYLVGALAILPFKDRLLMFGPQIQASHGNVIQRPLQDTVIWSWNGTPYYSVSSINPNVAALVPTNDTNSETADQTAWYVDQTGKGGYLSAGIAQPIMVVNNNEDVILIGFGGSGKKTRFMYTGNDLQPFLFYLINSELPSSCTFSGVVLDRGGIEIGSYGITVTTQQSCERIDLDIPDAVYEIQAVNNGQKRVNAIRDFFREWIYFSYPTGDGVEANSSWIYPSNTFLWNYRDNTWAIFRENFTHHGTFRKSKTYTWLTIPFPTWESWEEPWSSGSQITLFPTIIAGNPQGYVLMLDQGTAEGRSGDIRAIANDGVGFTLITSINHCVNVDDYLYFLNSIGNTFLNGLVGRVTQTPTVNTFIVDIRYVAGVYTGLGTFTRLSQPLIQTKQFPVYWQQGRGVRLGVQKYLMDYTANGQCTVNINLSQDPDIVWNAGPIVPNNSLNRALIYSQTLYTCPESTNIGLTPANTNLQMPVAGGAFQIWHRLNTSLTGDTFQVGITLSHAQMKNINLATSEVALYGMILNVSPGSQLA